MSNSILSTWKKQITSNLIATVKELYPEYQEDILKEITHAKTLELGDLSLPCFTIAKALKLAPPLIAKTIAEKIYLPNFIEKTVAVGPYVNIFFNRALFKNKVLENIFSKKDSLGKGTDSETIVLEYSSPNIAKSLHVGHLRTTLIGLCLERVLKHLGNKVHTINHLGDWGTQFGYVYAGCELFGKPKDPTIDDLVELYIKASSIRKEQDIAKGDKEKLKPEHRDLPIIKEMAEKYFIRLEAGDKEATEFWQWCLDVSLKYLKQNYERLGIFFDNYTGESFYSKMIPGVEKMIKDAGILEDSEGALGITLNEELGFVRIFTEDGRSLYITRDIAAAVYRHEHFKPVKKDRKSVV